tara:strand:+ start:430 stop:666 length:237 start_codon:yes stop_codon:yes gene_type:complete
METLIQPKIKRKMVSLDNLAYQVKEKSNNSKFGLDFKFYQRLFVIIITSFAFLIFPESPKDFEVLCRYNHSIKACNIW